MGVGYDINYVVRTLFKGWLIVNSIFWAVIGLFYGAMALFVRHLTSQPR